MPARSRYWRIVRSPFFFSIVVSFVLVSFYNWRFWSETIKATHLATVEDVLFLVSLFVILVLVHVTVLLLLPNPQALRIAAASVFIFSATTAFFIDSYSVNIDEEMIRNLFETDTQEASAFIVSRLGLYLLLLGVVPAIFALRTRLVSPPLGRRLAQRFGFLAISLAVTAGLLFQFYGHYTSFFSEHNTRDLLNPARPIAGLASYVGTELSSGTDAFIDDPDSHGRSLAAALGQKPLLVFLVVGETARAKNFQLGGYSRRTNPELATISNLFYFDNVVSCGTSTAVSVPCMFSPQGHETFAVADARQHSNLLDALQTAGVYVEWRENNSSSKGVAARVRTVNFMGDAKATGCGRNGCYDEDMVTGLASQLKELKQNSVIVFHDLGSHGPAYWLRYPPRFEMFKPVCRTGELWKCSREALLNTYDNTILYTDHVIAEQIRLLGSVSASVDSLLIYVSDHGESLGEHGLYLHGTPYAFAPEEQTRVPFLIWMSEGYRQRFSVDDRCLQTELHRPLTHDSVYHTVLGALGVRNARYKLALDVLGSCWRAN